MNEISALELKTTIYFLIINPLTQSFYWTNLQCIVTWKCPW